MEYTIVPVTCEWPVKDANNGINAMLADGWQLYGPPLGNGDCLFQGLIRHSLPAPFREPATTIDQDKALSQLVAEVSDNPSIGSAEAFGVGRLDRG